VQAMNCRARRRKRLTAIVNLQGTPGKNVTVGLGQRVDSCLRCSDVALVTHRGPEAFSCRFGAVIVLDGCLPDETDRVLIGFPVRSC
jgi:hypothetical protein